MGWDYDESDPTTWPENQDTNWRAIFESVKALGALILVVWILAKLCNW